MNKYQQAKERARQKAVNIKDIDELIKEYKK